MDEYGKNKKRLVIKMMDHFHAKFLVKLQESKIKQHDFFMEFINGFIEDDPIIHEWINKTPKIKPGKRSQLIRKVENNNIKRVNEQFNLDQKDLDELFDILEEDDGG